MRQSTGNTVWYHGGWRVATRVWWEQSCFRSFLARLEKRSCSSRTGTLSSAAICTCSVVDYCMHNKFQFDFTLHLISNINNGRRARRCAMLRGCWINTTNLCNYSTEKDTTGDFDEGRFWLFATTSFSSSLSPRRLMPFELRSFAILAKDSCWCFGMSMFLPAEKRLVKPSIEVPLCSWSPRRRSVFCTL